MSDRWRLYVGHASEVLQSMPEAFARCTVTSPPYYGLRSYNVPDSIWGGLLSCEHAWIPERIVRKHPPRDHNGHDFGETRAEEDARAASGVELALGATCSHCGAWRGQLGSEPTPALYIEHLVGIFREVHRALLPDGTLWVVIGDSYAANRSYQVADSKHKDVGNSRPMRVPAGMKPKDLLGIPWMLAFAMRADGWWLRDEIIWQKPNPLPYPAIDRTVRAHEQVFLFSKSQHYYFDYEAIEEASVRSTSGNVTRKHGDDVDKPGDHVGRSVPREGETRRARSVWTITSEPSREKHYATFPRQLARRCLLAGSRRDDIVLDPFAGTSRTGEAALKEGRRYVGIDISPSYKEISERVVSSIPETASVEEK